MINVTLNFNARNYVITYDAETGILDYVMDSESKEVIGVRYVQIGGGYDIKKPQNSYSETGIDENFIECNGIYVEIIGLSIFIPKRIFIPKIAHNL